MARALKGTFSLGFLRAASPQTAAMSAFQLHTATFEVVRISFPWLLLLSGLLSAQGAPIALAGSRWNPTVWRDSVGIPHIYGHSDAEVAFGLGWVQAEDVGPWLQESLLAARGLLGTLQGKDGALWDYLRAWTGMDTIEVRRLFSEQGWQILEAFAEGVNAYFRLHPSERLRPELFPTRAEDIARGSLLILQVMTGLGNLLPFLSRTELSEIGSLYQGYGSNAWAIAPSRSWDGGTYLLINSHQPLEGRLSWYEAEIYSQEGWHFRGGFFPGSPVPHLGANPALGWAHTMAYPQYRDVFQLTVKGRRYQVSKQDTTWWEPFTVRQVQLRIKGLPFSLKRKVYATRFGPAIRRKGTWYAITHWRPDSLHPIEVWYHLSKARNLQAFLHWLRVGALPAFYTIYADEEGHIGFFCTHYLPKRDSARSWTVPLSRPDVAYLSPEPVPFEELPHVVDPPCGYVYNANQTPLAITCAAANPKPTPLIGLQRFTYNRAERLKELWTQYADRPLTLHDLMSIKHDRCYAQEGSYRRGFEPLFNLDPERYPNLSEPIHALRRWKGCAEPQDTLTALVMLTHHYLEKITNLSLAAMMILGLQPTEAECAQALQKAARTLRRYYGTLYPQWQAVLRHGRGGVEVGVGGAPEVLEARHLHWDTKRHQFLVKGGDGLTYFIRWHEGKQTFFLLQPYGPVHRPQSPYYTNLIQRFAQQHYLEAHLTSAPLAP